MNRLNIMLLGLAAVQVLILVATLIFGGQEKGTASSGEKRSFLSFDPANIGALEISNPDDKTSTDVRIQRQGDGWVLATRENYPVKAERMEKPGSGPEAADGGILNKLVAIKVGPAVLQRKSNHDPVKVADERYERRVTLKDKNGNNVARFFVATGARARHVYVRMAGEDPVYETDGLSTWDLSTSNSTWIETRLTDLKLEDVKSAEVVLNNAAVSLSLARRQEPKPDDQTDIAANEANTSQPSSRPVEMQDVWYVSAPLEQKLKTSEVENTLRPLMALYFSDVAGKTPPLDGGFDKPLAHVRLTMKDDAKSEFIIGAKAGDDGYWVKYSGSEFYFKVSKWSLDGLVDLKLEKLLDTPESATPLPDDGDK